MSQIDSKFINHLTNYRFGGNSLKAVGNVCAPYVKVTLSLAGEPVNNLLKSIDAMADNSLNSVDTIVPDFLIRNPPTVEVEEQPKPVQKQPIESSPLEASVVEPQTSTSSPTDLPGSSYYETYVHSPLHQMAVRVRSSYSGVYDTKGKALVRGSLDSLVKPMNSSLEAFIETSIPHAKSVPQEGFSNEMSRTVRIILSALAGAIAPESQVRNYANSVMSPVTATVQSAREMSTNVRDYVANVVTPGHETA